MTDRHKEYKISGVSVFFPCKPYPSQLSMMNMILRGIERRQHCLLESPTGSGKSLALLCSSLAWQSAEKAKKELEEAAEAEKAACLCLCHQAPAVTQSGAATKKRANKQSDVCEAGNPSELPRGGATVDPDPDVFEIDDDNDFRTESTELKEGESKKDGRKHVTISYVEEEKSAATGKSGAGGRSAAGEQGKKGPELVCGLCTCASSETQKIKIPTIYFGTRTHRQVAQIVRELRKTKYHDTKMTILGSREHTCIHPEVSRMKSKNDGCRELLNDLGCRFKDSTQRITSQKIVKDMGLSSAWDLEDLVGLCKVKKACPYFLSRGLREEADLVICPYNYLVDPIIRDSMMISLKGHVVILDEAHNIEDAAREAASQSIGQDTLVKAIKDIDSLMEQNISLADHSKLRSMLRSLDSFVDNNKGQLELKDFDKSYKVWTGFYMVAQLEQMGMGPKHFPDFKAALAAVKTEAETRKEEAMAAGLRPDSVQMSPATTSVLEQVFQVMDYLYRADLKYVDDYRAALVQSFSFVPSTQEGQWLNSRKNKRHMTQVEIFTLNFWCLNPGVAFSDFEKTRSVILTSGTLSPMTSFQSELGLPFKIQLEANHVIKDSQVWVGALGEGPSGGTLQAVFRNLETFTFQDELGSLVLRVCQTVPHGVLCFLPSYKVLEKLTQRWEAIGLMRKLSACKQVICEPRGSDKADFEGQMKNFYEAVGSGAKGGSGEGEGDNCTQTGAIFFAVCRGKVSEGLDFADNFARAVISVGIPYPNFKDVQVELKRKYNDQHRQSRGLLSGHDWYEIQAFRALNQALGRCIRHKNDWGALIIVDERFVKNRHKYCKGLSKWVRNKVQTFPDFRCAVDSLSTFTAASIEAQDSHQSLDVSLAATPNSSSPSPRKPLNDVNMAGAPTPVTPGSSSVPIPASQTASRGQKNFFSLFTPFKSSPQTASPRGSKHPRSPSTVSSNNSSAPSSKVAGMMNKSPLPAKPVPSRAEDVMTVEVSPGHVRVSSVSAPSSHGAPSNSKVLTPCFLVPNSKNLATTHRIPTATVAATTYTPATTTTSALSLQGHGAVSYSTRAMTTTVSADVSPSHKLRIVTERARPGVRFRVFEIPAHLHVVFGGNLNLPVSTNERLVYLVDAPARPGDSPTAKLIKMSEEEKDAILTGSANTQHSAVPPSPTMPNVQHREVFPSSDVWHSVGGKKTDLPTAKVKPLSSGALSSTALSSTAFSSTAFSSTALSSTALSSTAFSSTALSSTAFSSTALSSTAFSSTAFSSGATNLDQISRPDAVPKAEVKIEKVPSSKNVCTSVLETEEKVNNEEKVTRPQSEIPNSRPAADVPDCLSPVSDMPVSSPQCASTQTPVLAQSKVRPLFKNSPVTQTLVRSESDDRDTKPDAPSPRECSTCVPTGQAVSPVEADTKTPAKNVRLTASKVAGEEDVVPKTESEDEECAEQDRDQTQVRRKVKVKKRRLSLKGKTVAKRARDTVMSDTNESKASRFSVFCCRCDHRLFVGKPAAEFRRQKMTPGFLASTETTDAQPGCVFFSTDPGEGGLQPLCDSRLGVNTRFVDQEDICVQYLYCESCLRNSDTPHSDTLDTRAQVAAGARVQLAAGTGARFSKGQMWLFASQVKVLPDEQD